MAARPEVAVVLVSLVLAARSAAAADETPVAVPPGRNMSNLDQYLTGTRTLVRIAAGNSFAPKSAEPWADGKVYSLALSDGAVVRGRQARTASRATHTDGKATQTTASQRTFAA